MLAAFLPTPMQPTPGQSLRWDGAKFEISLAVIPDASTTLAGLALAQTWTAHQTFDAITHTDGKDVSVGTGTGTKFGTATGQKLGFWNAAPVVQPSGAAQAAPAAYVTGAFGLDSDANMQALYDLVVAMRTALVNAGLMKGSA